MTTKPTSAPFSSKGMEDNPHLPAPPPDPPNDRDQEGQNVPIPSPQADINMGHEKTTQEESKQIYGYKRGVSPHSTSPTGHTAAKSDAATVHTQADNVTPRNENDWIKVLGTVKRKQSAITASAIDDTNYSIKTRIQERGEAAIDAVKCLITQVKIEFSTKTKKAMNLREEFLVIFQKMKQVDPSCAILTDSAVWTESKEIPVNEKFLDIFKVKQTVTARRNPIVTMFFTVESKQTVNAIKYHPIVWTHISQNQIYMYPDNFQTETTACPGFLINLHHKLIWKDTLLAQMRTALQYVRVETENKVVQRWKQQNPDATTDEVPFFTLKIATRKMGDVSATVFNVISAKKDAELLKMLFSKLGESEHATRWIFVPTGLHLIASPDLVKSSLRHQNEYTQGITAIAIEGITEECINTCGTNGTSLEESMHQALPGLESIEKTMLLQKRGRWLVIVRKKHQAQIRKYLIQTILPAIENSGYNPIPGVPVSIAGSLISPATVGTYANALKSRLTPT